MSERIRLSIVFGVEKKVFDPSVSFNALLLFFDKMSRLVEFIDQLEWSTLLGSTSYVYKPGDQRIFLKGIDQNSESQQIEIDFPGFYSMDNILIIQDKVKEIFLELLSSPTLAISITYAWKTYQVSQ